MTGVTKEMLEHAESYADYIEEQLRTDTATVLLEKKVDYSRWAPEGFGTADCIILQDGVLTVIDYKYGTGVPVSAESNPQMMLYGLAAWDAYGYIYGIHTVEMHIYQPRIGNISVASISVEDLLSWAERVVKPAAALAFKGEGDYQAGEHCRFCPHAGRCRQLTQTCTEFVAAHDLRIPALAPHETADVLAQEPLITLWLRKVKAQALSDLLEGREIPGWKCVEGRAGNRKWTDELQVAEALKAAGYDLSDITETKLLSPAAMDKSIGRKQVSELLAGMVDRAPGSPAIVPESDNRPVYERGAEFEILD